MQMSELTFLWSYVYLHRFGIFMQPIGISASFIWMISVKIYWNKTSNLWMIYEQFSNRMGMDRRGLPNVTSA